MSEQKKSIFDNPLTFLAASYPYLLVVLLGIGVVYVKNLGTVNENSLPARMFDSTTIVKELPVSDPAILTAVDAAMMKKPSDELIAKGKEIYSTSCASCHGADGKGDGAAGVAMNPKPRNFHSNDGWTNNADLMGMWKTLQEGISKNGMAAYDVLPADQRLGLIHYIRNTFMTNPPEITDASIKEIDDKYQLTKGTFKPGTIPVSGAVAFLEREDAGSVKKLESALKTIETKSKSDAGAKLFLGAVLDKNLALSFLLANEDWRDGTESFLKVVKRNLNANGFKYKVFTMEKSDVEKMFNFLKSSL
jgi:mono/diheme cytochrome c family protein